MLKDLYKYVQNIRISDFFLTEHANVESAYSQSRRRLIISWRYMITGSGVVRRTGRPMSEPYPKFYRVMITHAVRLHTPQQLAYTAFY